MDNAEADSKVLRTALLAQYLTCTCMAFQNASCSRKDEHNCDRLLIEDCGES